MPNPRESAGRDRLVWPESEIAAPEGGERDRPFNSTLPNLKMLLRGTTEG